MKIERKCPVCDVVYEAESNRLKVGRQTTCSRKCSYIWRKRNQLAKRIECECSVCGNKISRAISKIKSKHKAVFCSRKCHYVGRTMGLTKRVVIKPYNISDSARLAWKKGAQKARNTRIARNNYRHSDSTKVRLSKATSEAIASGRLKKISGIEYEVRDWLISRGVKFIHQFPIRNPNGTYACCFDFFLPDRNLAVEVNGTFFHSDPRFFPDGPIYEIQKRNAVAWERKISIAESLGIKICILWEYDLGKDFTNTVSTII